MSGKTKRTLAWKEKVRECLGSEAACFEMARTVFGHDPMVPWLIQTQVSYPLQPLVASCRSRERSFVSGTCWERPRPQSSCAHAHGLVSQRSKDSRVDEAVASARFD